MSNESEGTIRDAHFREQVLRARAIPMMEKMVAGIRLFEEECDRMRSAIRTEFPDADPAQVEHVLRERLRRLREAEDQGIYMVLPNQRLE